MAMLEDTMNDMDNDEVLPQEDTALSDAVLAEYATLNPFIIYLDGGENVKGGRLSVAILEGVRTATTANPNSIKVRKQGVRKGEKGFDAKATLSARKLVPVLALVEESLIDEMLVSPAALAAGMAALRGRSGPDHRDMVDMVVEEYEESAPIARQFFPSEDGVIPAVPTAPTAMGVHATDTPSYPYTGQYTEPMTVAGDVISAGWEGNPAPVPTSTGWTGQYIMPSPPPPELAERVAAVTAENMYDGNYVTPTAAGDVLTATPHADVTVTATETYATVDAMGVVTAVPSPYGTVAVPSQEPGIVADGELLDFNPEVHIIPQ